MGALATMLTVTELSVGRPKSSGPEKLTCPCALGAKAPMIRRNPQNPTAILVLSRVVFIDSFSSYELVNPQDE
jgi:hypothetical protein